MMRFPLIKLLHISLFIMLGITSPSQAIDRSVRIMELQEMRSEKRVALVIGNSDYKSSPLKNPVNDARLVAKTSATLGLRLSVVRTRTRSR